MIFARAAGRARGVRDGCSERTGPTFDPRIKPEYHGATITGTGALSMSGTLPFPLETPKLGFRLPAHGDVGSDLLGRGGRSGSRSEESGRCV